MQNYSARAKMPWRFKYPFNILASMYDMILLGPPNAASCSLCCFESQESTELAHRFLYVVPYKHTKAQKHINVHLLRYCFHALDNMFKHGP